MHIELATAHNFGLFKHLEQPFHRGLVGIVGPNGAGKSTLVNGIFATLTNDFSRFLGVKTDQIHDMADPKEESFFEVAAEHEGRKFYIRRSLRPNKSELKIHGEKAITKAPEIERRLQEDLGVDTRLIGTYVFVDQWRMFDFLDLTPAKRAEAFKYLCRTEQADRIFQACASMLSDNAGDQDVVDNSDELTTQIGTIHGELETLAEQRAQHQVKLLNEKSLKSARGIVKKREKYTELVDSMDRAEKREPKLRRIVAKRKKVADKYAKHVHVDELDVGRQKKEAEEARAALKSWETYEKRRKRRSKLTSDQGVLHSEPSLHPEPKMPEDYGSLSRYRAFLANARNEKKIALAVIETYEQNQSGKCPTCQQEIDASHVARFKKDVVRCDNVIKDMKPKVEACEAYQEAQQEWAEWKSGWEARKQAVAEELASLKDLKEPKGDKEALEAAVATFEKAEADLKQSKEKKTSADKAYEQVEQRLKALEKHITKLGERITAHQVEDKLLAKAEKRLGEHEAARLAIATIDGQITEKRSRHDEAVKKLEALKAVLRRRKKLIKAMKTLEKTRDVFHWSALPWRVAQQNLTRMEGHVNDALTWFGDPFWVQADDKLSFTVHLPGRTPKRAEALSGGQKGVLAMAFRAGANAVFNLDLGMMFLDEPTSGLDKDNVAFLVDALGELAGQVRNKRQLVIVTHEDSLKPAFDQVIEIKAAA